jgi:hypothetical protein
MVAATGAASFSASAALYNVYMYGPVDSSSQTFGSAIQQSTASCWTNDCSSHETDNKIAYEEQRFPQGFDYRLEAPFLIENGFEYLEDGYRGFDDYCNRYLDYADSLCDKWANRQYSQGYGKEVSGDYENSSAYVETIKVASSTNNIVINSFIDSSDNVIGSFQVDENERTRGFSVDTSSTFDGGDRSQAFAQLGGLTVGSVSTKSSKYSKDYTSKAAVWDGATLHSVSWNSAAESSRSMPQGSARDIANVGGVNYAVGYNADSDELPVAAVFNLANLSDIKSTLLYPTGKSDYEDSFLNSKLTSVNNNGIAIGTAKYRTGNDGSINDRLLYVSDVTNPQTSWVSGGVFFTSANAKAGAINNNDELVGQVDFDRFQETNGGKPRGKKAFIASLSANSVAPIGSSSRYLDDLTYGSNAQTSNNDYRIIDASDINDAGVIAGTAYHCTGGFDSSAIDANCSAGASLVAVKLVPINGATSSDIVARPQETTKVERQGAGFGILSLTLLGLLGFRRK